MRVEDNSEICKQVLSSQVVQLARPMTNGDPVSSSILSESVKSDYKREKTLIDSHEKFEQVQSR